MGLRPLGRQDAGAPSKESQRVACSYILESMV